MPLKPNSTPNFWLKESFRSSPLKQETTLDFDRRACSRLSFKVIDHFENFMSFLKCKDRQGGLTKSYEGAARSWMLTRCRSWYSGLRCCQTETETHWPSCCC